MKDPNRELYNIKVGMIVHTTDIANQPSQLARIIRIDGWNVMTLEYFDSKACASYMHVNRHELYFFPVERKLPSLHLLVARIRSVERIIHALRS